MIKIINQLVIEIYGRWANQSSAINELRIYNKDTVVSYSVDSVNAYESTNTNVPTYWNSTVWDKTKLNDNNTNFSSTSTTALLRNGSDGELNEWSRFLVTLSQSISDKDLKLEFYIGANSGTGGLPKEISAFSVMGAYNINTQLKTRENIGLSLIDSISIAQGVYRTETVYLMKRYINKVLINSGDSYFYLDENGDWENLQKTPTEQDYLDYGIDNISSITREKWMELDNNVKIKYYTNDTLKADSILEVETDPFSVYDYISENPQVIIYTESTDDITVSTTTEPFTVYDEFGDSVDVLYYTDDETATEADLVLEANWSPIDELEGDFEVVTWTDEPQDTAHRTLDMTSIPTSKFAHSKTITDISNGLNKISIVDKSVSITGNRTKYLLTPDNINWFKWNGVNFVQVSIATESNIKNNGMNADIINSLTPDQLKLWNFTSINIGVLLDDDIRNNYSSNVTSLGLEKLMNTGTSTVSDMNFYILNTTAQININLHGLTLIGTVSDADMTRVQYRVILNGNPYFPENGDFTPLSQPPLNIDLTLRTDEIKIGDWNTLTVEFQDYFGTTDSWEVQFIGEYTGLMFSDINGDYYSTDLGQVLKYLNFGDILTGQVTPYQEIKLTNKYGFNLKDVKIMVNTLDFANGLTVDLDKDLRDNIDATKELIVGNMLNGSEYQFNIRLRSDPDTIPNGNTHFDIVAMGMRDV